MEQLYNQTKCRQYSRAIHEKLLEIIADNELTQHQMEPTKLGRILDLFFTKWPKITENIHTLSATLDHDIPKIDCDTNQRYNEK